MAQANKTLQYNNHKFPTLAENLHTCINSQHQPNLQKLAQSRPIQLRSPPILDRLGYIPRLFFIELDDLLIAIWQTLGWDCNYGKQQHKRIAGARFSI
jgi:flagellar basal body P-ring protein FlgI